MITEQSKAINNIHGKTRRYPRCTYTVTDAFMTPSFTHQTIKEWEMDDEIF